MAGRPVGAETDPMPTPTRSALGEAAITTTLLSIYISARGTNRALGAVQAAIGGLERSRGRLAPPVRGGPLLEA